MHLNKNKYIIYLLFIVVVSLFWTCSPKFGYGVKSLLFDGVPDPYKVEVSIIKDSLLVKDSTSTNEISSTAIVKNLFNLHTPYKERECSKCHDRNNMDKPRLPSPELCNQCHEDFNNTYKVLHGPVASGDCTECHNPHQSKLKSLLKWSGQDICLQCHNMETLFIDEDHKEINDTSCTECHNPHGGDNINLLLVKQ